MAPTQSNELITKRNTLAEARRATQAKVGSLAVAALIAGRLLRVLREDPWVMVASGVVVLGVVIRWIAQYRRLKAELGLQEEYDEIEEQTTAFRNTMLILFGLFGAMFLFLAVFISVFGKR